LERLTISRDSKLRAAEAFFARKHGQEEMMFDLTGKMALITGATGHIGGGIARTLHAQGATVGISGNYGEQSWNYRYDGTPTVTDNQPQYAALLTINWDLFTGFKRLNDLRQAEADRDAAGAQLKSLEVGAISSVWRAYYEFQTALSRYSYAKALLAASQESYDANLDTYKQGLSTIVELLTADRDLANARYTIVQSRADLLTSSAAVAFAVGAIEMPRP